jgi:hypothetical protein
MDRRKSRLTWLAFAGLLCAQLILSQKSPDHWRLENSPGVAPSALAARLASLDEPQLASYAAALYLQGFDAQAGALLPLRSADFPAVLHWLELAHELNPHSGYPLMLAAFDYAETAHMQDELAHATALAAPPILDFVERGFQADPSAQWHWLAHAAWVSRYVLHDDARALAEARLLRDAPASADIPRWARELDTYVLGRSDPLQARRALLGGLVATERANGKAGRKPGNSTSGALEIQRLAGRLEAESEAKERNRDPNGGLIPPYPKSSTGEDHR